jgi:Cu(I)/Ag(I) efflux system membrane fusion protein
MGDPLSVDVQERKVWVCCAGCTDRLKSQPAKYISRLDAPPRDEILSIPESSVIDTGSRKIVYVESEPGVFEGREVILGPRIGNRFPVLEGLAPGERVAAAGAFLIDAESRINPGAARSAPGHDAAPKSRDPVPRSAVAPNESIHRH